MMTWAEKLKSRTFWICVATFLSSLATSIAALNNGNDGLAGVGIFCATLSAAIFATADAVKDSAYLKANATITTVTTTPDSTSNTVTTLSTPTTDSTESTDTVATASTTVDPAIGGTE